jgi:4a-hydroxytetrahydrobiopterin dehydratase
MSLADQKCVPCRGGVPPLDRSRIDEMLGQLDKEWRLNAEGHLERIYRFDDFMPAMAFANRLAEIAEEEGHHPDLHISWGKCRVEVWTHKIHGLTESDFYLAAKADRTFQSASALSP